MTLRRFFEGGRRALPEVWKAEIDWRTHADAARSRERLRACRDRHAGRRCFILGNGPSLNRMDLSPLRNEITFGTNRIYLLFDKLGFETTYYVAADRMFIRQFAKEIAALRPPKFLNWQASDSCGFTDGTAFWNSRSYLGVERFSSRIDREIVEGRSVTYACMQIARYMGFNEVVLIGVDHHYRNAVDTNAAYSPLRGPDLDHFDPAYFTKDQLIGRPDLKGAEAGYRLARTVYAREGRCISDATVSGKLDVFPKIDYSRCFTDKLS